MSFKEFQAAFEKDPAVYESHLLTFSGVDGLDVYNCSVPFERNGRRYIYGRIDVRNVELHSRVMLFEETGTDQWSLVKNAPVYQLEDPFITLIGDEILLGGTHVRLRAGELETYYAYFYRGTDPFNLSYYTTGPDLMKDIRLVELPSGKIGVFSRPREGTYENGALSQIGFTVINDLKELTAEVIGSAVAIPGIFSEGEWGGVNQACNLRDGRIGCIGHAAYNGNSKDGITPLIYLNCSFIFDPAHMSIDEFKIIGTRKCYPECGAKRPDLTYCTFTSGIILRADGRADLYSGVGDAYEGRIVIDDPFAEYR